MHSLTCVRWAAVAAALLILMANGCGRQPARKTLVLYCGAGIRPPAEDLAEQFEQRHEVRVECDFAGSEVLLSRIKLSRKGDVFLPGDVHYVDLARGENLVADSRTACFFVPVILVAKGNPRRIHTLADLARPGVRVGLGDAQACAIGRKAARIFEKNEISDEDLAENIVFRSLTVNELGDKVKLGALDAVIVWDATAAYYADATDVVRIPSEQNVISTVPAAVLTTSQHPELAAAFVEFAVSPEGQAIFAKHHYAVSVPP